MKIILFGSTGMLGRYIFNVLQNDYEIICINRKHFDITTDNWSKLNDILIAQLKTNDIIINCAGIIPQKYNDNDYKTYIRVNTLFPHKLNEISLRNNYKFIHITTDCVFDGQKGNYTVEDIHSTKDIYGISKSLGEPEEATIIRTSIIGEELFGKKSLIEWVKSNKNKTINGYTNHFWNGVTCLTLAKIIENIINKTLFWKGVRHIFSPNTVTKNDLCNYINKIYELNINIIPYNNIITKNMLLSGENIFEIKDIFIQIEEQKNYSKYGIFKNLQKCRFCDSYKIKEIIKFNDFPLSGCFLKDRSHIINEKIYPLTLLYCDNCNTGLIKEIINQDNLFTNINESGYYYYSSTITYLIEHFKNLSNLLIKIYPNKKKILEIGCNDGVFINNFVNKNYSIIGIDPSETISKIISNEIIKYNNYFDENICNEILTNYGKQDIIVCCNCLAHIDNINVIYKNIKKLLSDDGVLIIEVHYLKQIIYNYNFDFIYHEHMSYYTISTIIKICEVNNLYLKDIEFIDTHGGSLRAFITQPINNIFYNNSLDKYIYEEQNINIQINNLFNDLNEWKNKLINIIDEIKRSEQLLIGYGASGRTNMIINYLSIKFDIILDDSPYKIGSYMPYYHNKIIDSKDIFTNNNIKCIFILAWPYTKSIILKNIEFIKNGGIFYKILPDIEKIDNSNYLQYI